MAETSRDGTPVRGCRFANATIEEERGRSAHEDARKAGRVKCCAVLYVHPHIHNCNW